MTTDPLSILSRHELRLAQLERQNRRLRLLCTLGVLGLPLLAFAHPFRIEDEVRAKAFLLVDDRGEVRARLHMEQGDVPSFEMTDVDGKRRIDMYVKGTEAVSVMLDDQEHSRIGHAIDVAGQPHTVYFDAAQRPRLHLAVDAQGFASLSCIGPAGTIDAGLGIEDKTGPWLRPDPAGAAAVEQAPTVVEPNRDPLVDPDSQPDRVPPTGTGQVPPTGSGKGIKRDD